MLPDGMPIRHTRALMAGALALGIGVLTALPSSLAAAATGSPSTRWAASVAQLRLLPDNATPNPDVGGTLAGVSADSRANAWAVGNYSTSTAPYVPFIAHWNGTEWRTVPSPNPGLADGTSLHGVSALSPTDAWAVGNDTPSPGTAGAVILHWDGTSWRQVRSPRADDPELFAVSAVSATDAWAVGIYSSSKVNTFIAHWNGTRWIQVPSPSPGSGAILNAVSARSATDAWAVGYYATTASSKLRPLTLHWNGTRWTEVSSPNPVHATGDTGLLGVSTISPDDAWAAGYSGSADGATFLLHWNGIRWARVCTPNPPKPGSGEKLGTVLSGVSAGSAADVMVTGWYVVIDKADDTFFTAFALRWNGRSWTQLPESTPGGQLYGTSLVSAKDVWAVGSSTPGTGATGTLIVHWDGAHWTEVPSPY
jgi:hypothetical protein